MNDIIPAPTNWQRHLSIYAHEYNMLMPNYNLIAARCEMDHYVLCYSSNVRVAGNIRHMLICMLYDS